jgi:SAM-dependent methyltransferase
VSQPLIRAFVADADRAIGFPEPIVEFGSMQVEPDQDADLRPLFGGREFVGTDMRPGPGVDRIEDLRKLTFADGEVGTALCLDTLEHCQDPVQACRELARVTAEGGVAVISSVMLFGVHAYPNDYFRFTPQGFRSLLSGFDSLWVGAVGDPDIPFQVVGIGAKRRDLRLSPDDFPSIGDAQERWERARGQIRIGPFRYPPRELARVLLTEAVRNARERLAGRLPARAAGATRPGAGHEGPDHRRR